MDRPGEYASSARSGPSILHDGSTSFNGNRRQKIGHLLGEENLLAKIRMNLRAPTAPPGAGMLGVLEECARGSHKHFFPSRTVRSGCYTHGR